MTTQKRLPSYPETKAIFRAGLAEGTSLNRIKKHASSIVVEITPNPEEKA